MQRAPRASNGPNHLGLCALQEPEPIYEPVTYAIGGADGWQAGFYTPLNVNAGASPPPPPPSFPWRRVPPRIDAHVSLCAAAGDILTFTYDPMFGFDVWSVPNTDCKRQYHCLSFARLLLFCPETGAFACGAAAHYSPCSKCRLSSSMMARITSRLTPLRVVLLQAGAQHGLQLQGRGLVGILLRAGHAGRLSAELHAAHARHVHFHHQPRPGAETPRRGL